MTDDEESWEVKTVKPTAMKFTEFDCPSCSANNPCDEFGHKGVVFCGFCGMEWEARVSAEGLLSFKEL